MAYAKRYAGGFNDLGAAGGTPADSTFLNTVEAALLKLYALDPTDGQIMAWVAANSRFEPTLLKNANIDPAASIAKSKLAALSITDADVAGGAAIAQSKLALSITNAQIDAAAAIAISKLAGYPADATKVLKGDGSWGAGTITYRKTSAKQVVNSIAETDLLNGEITVAAGAMGTDRMLRLTAYGDWKQNSGATSEVPRFKLKLGTTTLLDTNVSGANVVANSVNRLGWRIVCEITNLGAANAQWATFSGELTSILGGGGNSLFVTGEGQLWAIGAVAGYSGVHYNGGGAGAVDTTLAQALALSVVLPVASANCDITLKGALVEVI